MPSSPGPRRLRSILKCSDEGYFCALTGGDNPIAGGAPYTTLTNIQVESESE